MALIHETVTPQGVPATYHKLIKVEISAIDCTVVAVMAIYASAAARDSGKQALWHEYITIPFDEFEVDPRVPFYALVANHVGSYLNGAQSDVDPNAITP